MVTPWECFFHRFGSRWEPIGHLNLIIWIPGSVSYPFWVTLGTLWATVWDPLGTRSASFGTLWAPEADHVGDSYVQACVYIDFRWLLEPPGTWKSSDFPNTVVDFRILAPLL